MNVAAIKAAIRKRDGYRCTGCGISQDDYRRLVGRALDVHRKTPGSLYTVQGAETLCGACHSGRPKSPHGGSDRVRIVVGRDRLTAALGISSLHGINLTALLFQLIAGAQSPVLTAALDQAKRSTGRLIRLAFPPALFARLEAVATGLGLDVSNLVRMVLYENLLTYEERVDQVRKGRKHDG